MLHKLSKAGSKQQQQQQKRRTTPSLAMAMVHGRNVNLLICIIKARLLSLVSALVFFYAGPVPEMMSDQME